MKGIFRLGIYSWLGNTFRNIKNVSIIGILKVIYRLKIYFGILILKFISASEII